MPFSQPSRTRNWSGAGLWVFLNLNRDLLLHPNPEFEDVGFALTRDLEFHRLAGPPQRQSGIRACGQRIPIGHHQDVPRLQSGAFAHRFPYRRNPLAAIRRHSARRKSPARVIPSSACHHVQSGISQVGGVIEFLRSPHVVGMNRFMSKLGASCAMIDRQVREGVISGPGAQSPD